MTKAKKKTKAIARTERAPRPMTNAEINAHPLLDREQMSIAKNLRDLAKTTREPFAMLDFAKVSLRASGCDYATASKTMSDASFSMYGPPTTLLDEARLKDAELRHAAILYVREALLSCARKEVTETLEARGVLRDLEILAMELP